MRCNAKAAHRRRTLLGAYGFRGLQSLKMNQRGGGRKGEVLHLDLKVEGREREWYQSFETPKPVPVTAMATILVLSPSFCSLVWIKTEFLQVAYPPTCL